MYININMMVFEKVEFSPKCSATNVTLYLIISREPLAKVKNALNCHSELVSESLVI